MELSRKKLIQLAKENKLTKDKYPESFYIISKALLNCYTTNLIPKFMGEN